MPTDEPTDLAQVARELYAVVPAEFVSARNSRAARLRQDKRRELAAEVKRLPKASVAAWAVNAVVREAGEDVDALGELGAELRVAQRLANPAELRALSRRRREQVAALTRVAARLAAERDVELSSAAREQVADTWQAMVIDPRAERVGRSGLLARPLEPGDDDPGSALAVPHADGEPGEEAAGGPALRLVRAEGAGGAGAEHEDEDADERDAADDAEGGDEAGDAEDDADADEGADVGDGEGADADDDSVDGEVDAPDVEADEPPESHVRGGIRIRRAQPDRSGTGARDARRVNRADSDTRDSGRRAAGGDRRGAGGGDTGRAASEDPGREERRLRRELRSRERIAAGLREELEDATEELGRVEAEVLQVAARLEELRRGVLESEQRLEQLDEARVAALEEKEDAQERVREAEEELAEVRDRLSKLDSG